MSAGNHPDWSSEQAEMLSSVKRHFAWLIERGFRVRIDDAEWPAVTVSDGHAHVELSLDPRDWFLSAEVGLEGDVDEARNSVGIIPLMRERGAEPREGFAEVGMGGGPADIDQTIQEIAAAVRDHASDVLSGDPRPVAQAWATLDRKLAEWNERQEGRE